MTTNANSKEKIEAGRGAVDNYRTAHTWLHAGGWYPEIHDDHTRLLGKLKSELTGQGFTSLAEFFNQSELVNITELGFADRVNFEMRGTEANREALEQKWH